MAATARVDLGAQVVLARDTSRLMTPCYPPVILIIIISIISISELALTFPSCRLGAAGRSQWSEPESQGLSSPGASGSVPHGSQSFTPPVLLE